MPNCQVIVPLDQRRHTRHIKALVDITPATNQACPTMQYRALRLWIRRGLIACKVEVSIRIETRPRGEGKLKTSRCCWAFRVRGLCGEMHQFVPNFSLTG